jgi:hypothetical protein
VLALVGTRALAAVDLSSFSADVPAPVSNELFLIVGAQGTPASPHDLGAAKAWPVKINLAHLAGLPPDVVVNFPDREFAHLHRTRFEDRGPGAFLWVGEGNGCAGLFSAIPNSFRAILACGNGPYGVEKVPHGEDLQLTWYDQSLVPPVDDGPANTGVQVGKPSEVSVIPSPSGMDSVIDILVLYTEGVRQLLDPDGGEVNSRQYAQDLVNTTQMAMDRSTTPGQPIIAQVALAHAQKVSRPDTGDFDADLSYLRFDAEPTGLRNFWAADVVMYITTQSPSTNYCGSSNEPGANNNPPPGPAFAPIAFGVVRKQCGISAYTFQHEFGHVLGANHNVESSGNSTPLRPYAYGHWYADLEAGYRTLMSMVSSGCKPSCFQVLNYSNAAVVTDDGFVTGAATRNNAEVLEEFAPVTAQYRSSLGRIFADRFE